ncbi:DUF4297 domain-containing protein [Vibrio europaeus]|uniref:DUF4297 domain-containing protein n=1 Tax=Vibrio europaeus TaxID=300876 RepID=A0ABT5GT60_9VIBR|nr:hypothetical protein [Vibrio europaeus]MDC5703461.1 hypothetical protein [Vibrio europaeus]MDC5711384.1 DUF4297 domain-containing protein [Vibrio europaeus]MDC5714877.1 DUF4297 domain-containing protein [Vibrio europaeus]MDC5727495.1 DUF4297 domain-containing protein [Vibrio europaeus]MDC5729728.1 DUF4297 domain-containing protein [Vibrio europaeus]
MSDGYQALKGFEYQATVNLDLIIKYFNHSNENISLRPEGEDDLVIMPEKEGTSHFFQIKKPKETESGVLKNEPWTLTEIVHGLLVGTFERLNGNQHRQTWILGDEVNIDVHKLLSCKLIVDGRNSNEYIRALHLLAKQRSKIVPRTHSDRRSLNLWKPESKYTPNSLMASFEKRLKTSCIPQDQIDQYKIEVNRLHEVLPSVLQRTSVEVVYGTDQEVRDRIQYELKEKYKLDWEVSKNTLLPCLRNFVSTVSSQRGRIIKKSDFEAEVRNIWPRMTMVCSPQSIQETDIRRTKLVDKVLSDVQLGALEVIGISGSGKTTLASEIIERVELESTPTKAIYLAVRSDRDFRDVISGIAFNLRNSGVDGLLPIAVNYQSSDESSLLKSAKFLSSINIDLLCIIDLVDGQCSNTFSRELAIFLENLSGNNSKFIVMGQSSSFHYLSALQKKKLKLPETINMAGFSFDEFIELSEKLCPHLSSERAVLFEVYNALTASRSSMLYARLANLVASCRSLEEMQGLAKLPADEVLQEADRLKYNLLRSDVKRTADKLFCFMLPFQEKQASGIFTSDRVREAIIELVKYGLLRKLDNNHYEFHETTRRGMESLTPPEIKISTHAKLADYYESIGDIVAMVYHLEQSGRHVEAKKLAKEQFLSGNSRAGLEAYVKKHKLVTSSEIVGLIFETTNLGNSYMLPKMLDDLGNSDTANLILERLKEDPSILSSNFQKTWQITEAIQLCDCSKLYELVKIALTQPTYTDKPDALEYIVQGVRNPKSPLISSELKELFKNQKNEIKIKIVPLFLLDKRREILSEVFSFLYAYEEPLDIRSNGLQSSVINNLKIDDLAEVEEFLSAIPIPQCFNTMLLHKSPNLGLLESYIWNRRYIIKPLCVDFVRSDSVNENALINALRVLLFLQDENVLLFRDKVLTDKDRLGSLAQIIPSIYPNGIKLSKHQEKMLNPDIQLEKRVADFIVFYQAGGDIDSIYGQLIQADADNTEVWKNLILIASMLKPSIAAISILEEKLAEDHEAFSDSKLAPIICRLGELPGADVDEFLLRILGTHEDIAIMSCLSLQTRRLKQALPMLLGICRERSETHLGKMALVAAIASYPNDIADFKDIWPMYPDMEIWRCILIGRLKALNEADWLVQIITDTSKHWQVRRAAILASGNLPYEASLEKIYRFVLGERSSLLVDYHPSLLMHNILTTIVLEERSGLLRFFMRGRREFAVFWGEIFQGQAAGSLFEVDKDAGQKTAFWLYDRLEHYGWPTNDHAQDCVLNELHIPVLQAAVLRGLRLSGRTDLIEDLLPSTKSEWLLMRILCELGKVPNRTQADIDRYKVLMSKGVLNKSIPASNCLKNMSISGSEASQREVGVESENIESTVLDYEQIRSIISSEKSAQHPSWGIGSLSPEEFLELVRELDPKNDYETNISLTTPALTLGESGPTIRSSQLSSIDKNKNVRELLRPLLASKNIFGFEVHWHSSLLSGEGESYSHVSEQYFLAFLDALVVHKNSDLLYLELEKRSDLILPALGKVSYQPSVAKIIDSRIVPYLLKYANSGSDDMLESLCYLAACVTSLKIDCVLERLFLRWVNRFDRDSIVLQHYHNTPLWRAFNSLRKHPRFTKIPNYDIRLMEILPCNMAWYSQDYIINALSTSRKSYITLETRLMKSAPFEHYGRDEVDRLSDAAESLFSEVESRVNNSSCI